MKAWGRSSAYFRRVKWLMRILGGLFMLAVAGMVALLALGIGTKQELKDAVKTFIGKKPQSIRGIPPPAAGMQVLEEGLATGDEPPFSLAAGPWSKVEFDSNGQAIHPNLRFDFEIHLNSDSTRLSSAWSHAGRRSYRMLPGEEYSPAIRRRCSEVATTLSAVEVGFWSWSPSPNTLVTAVVSIDRDGKQLAWFGKDLRADTSVKRGARLNCNYLLRDLGVLPDDQISVYLWKRGGADAFIDDMDVYFHSSEVPGRTNGTALPLDSVGRRGGHPMGYAAILVKDVEPDTVRFHPGAPAPSTTVDDVRFGTSDNRWRFVPDQGVAYLVNAQGIPTAMLRPWSPVSRTDLTHFERVVARAIPQGVEITGLDVEVRDGKEVVASIPAPMALILELSPPR